MILMGILSAFAILVLLFKFGIRKAMGYDLQIDVLFTVILTFLFAGTFIGMAAAIIGGLTLSILLLVIKPFSGSEKLKLVKTIKGKRVVHRIKWVNF